MKRILLLICIMLMITTTCAVAGSLDPNRLLNIGYSGSNVDMMAAIETSTNFSGVITNLTLVLTMAGIGIGVCVGVIYAIMWITATPKKKADLKERAFPFVLGILLLSGGTGLALVFISGISKIL